MSKTEPTVEMLLGTEWVITEAYCEDSPTNPCYVRIQRGIDEQSYGWGDTFAQAVRNAIDEEAWRNPAKLRPAWAKERA